MAWGGLVLTSTVQKHLGASGPITFDNGVSMATYPPPSPVHPRWTFLGTVNNLKWNCNIKSNKECGGAEILVNRSFDGQQEKNDVLLFFSFCQCGSTAAAGNRSWNTLAWCSLLYMSTSSISFNSAVHGQVCYTLLYTNLINRLRCVNVRLTDIWVNGWSERMKYQTLHFY